MKFITAKLLAITVVAILPFLPSAAQTQPAPRIFATDLESGPRTGGQSGQGAWVTVYGKGFGATRGNSQVTIGGVPAYAYATWSDKKIAFQVSSGAVTGNITVNVASVTSNAVPFTVRSGRIYFVAPTGNDAQKGTYNRPWRTLTKAVSAMRPGDIVYAANGTSAATLQIARAGSSGSPFAIVAYPNATVTIGSATGQDYGVRALSGGYNQWVLAGLTLSGRVKAVDVTSVAGWRLVGNDVSCPNGYGSGACVQASSSSDIKFLANRVHDSGSTTSTDVANYASVQLAASNVEVGWNEIGNTRSCRALSFQTSGVKQYGLSVHDNYIHDAVCDGISFGNVDPTRGPVQAYNNIVQRVGTGPAPGGVEQNYACIQASGNSGGSVQILNNTLYDCGAYVSSNSGAVSAATALTLTNNIISLQSGQSYITSNTSSSLLSGSNNLLWGGTNAPASLTTSIALDPQFVSAANSNFALQSTSPAIDMGTNSGVSTDYAGVIRPQGKATDIGAYEYMGSAQTGTGQLAPNPTSINFGTLNVGTSDTRSVTVINTGNANATISQMNTTGAGFSARGLTLPATLAPGQSVSFTVTYSPLTAGNASGNIELISDAANASATVQLTGSATTPAATLNAPSTLSFGNVNIGSSGTQNVTVSASTGSVTISQATVSGTGFSISGLALPATLAAGQSATFQVKFTPTAAGTATGSIALVSNASNSPTTIALSGTGATVAGTLTPTPTTLNFGNVILGNSTTQNVTLTATTANVTVSGYTISAGFTVSGLSSPVTISPGQTVTFQVKFAPTASGAVNGTLRLVSNATNSVPDITLSGTGIVASSQYSLWSASTVPPTVDSGDGQAVELGVKFKSDVSGYITGIRYYKSAANTGTHRGNLWSSSGTLLATAIFSSETASGWQQVNFATPVAVTAGTVYIASYYTPTGHYSNQQNFFATSGVDNGPLHALANTTSANGVYAYGSASSFPNQTWLASNYWVDVVFAPTAPVVGTLAVTPGTLSFGSVITGSSASQNITVAANTASVTISQANVTGAGFSISGLTLPTTLAAGQSATFQVKFAPTAVGSVSGSVSLVSNGSNSPTAIALSGTGATAIAHSAALTWTASTSTGVVGYNVYRGTQTGGPYTKLTASPVAVTSYTDTGVQAGANYYYVVTAVNSTGQESTYSNQVLATIPTP